MAQFASEFKFPAQSFFQKLKDLTPYIFVHYEWQIEDYIPIIIESVFNDQTKYWELASDWLKLAVLNADAQNAKCIKDWELASDWSKIVLVYCAQQANVFIIVQKAFFKENFILQLKIKGFWNSSWKFIGRNPCNPSYRNHCKHTRWPGVLAVDPHPPTYPRLDPNFDPFQHLK